MKLIIYRIILIFFTCVGLTLTACSSYNSEQGDLSVVENDNSDVTLTLHVSVSDASESSSTRADNSEEATKPNSFEQIHTLRVIIVRPDQTVEYNRLASLPEGESTDKFGNLDFKVSTSQGELSDDMKLRSEKKRVYLIANEASIVPSYIRREFENLKVGNTLEADRVLNLYIYKDWDSGTGSNGMVAIPFINNEEENKKNYVLMTEYFDIDVVADLSIAGKEQVQEEKMFLTRNLIKFQFTAQSESASFNVTAIRFEKVMQREFLFPKVKYFPNKDDLDATEREIVSFETPDFEGNLTRPYIFKPTNFQFRLPSGNEEITPAFYSPFLYFCETKVLELYNGIPLFQVGIDVEFLNPDGTTDEVVSYSPQRLNNLPKSIPRNSIVRVDMTLKNGILNCEVTVLPYTGVWLDPSFGIDRVDEGNNENENEGEEENESENEG